MESVTYFVRDGSGRPVAGVGYPRTIQEMDEWFWSDAGFHRLAQQAVVVGPILYRTIIGAAGSNRQTPELE